MSWAARKTRAAQITAEIRTDQGWIGPRIFWPGWFARRPKTRRPPVPSRRCKRAFVDVMRKSDGSPLDPRITANFNCLKETGEFCARDREGLLIGRRAS